MSLQAVPGSSCPPALAQGMQYTSTQEAKIGESQAGFVLTWQHCEQLHVHSLPSPPSLPNLPGPLPLHMDSKASKSQRVEHGFEWNKISHEAKQELLLHSCATMSQNRNTDSTWCNNRTLVTLRPNTHRTSRHGVESPNHWNSTRPPGWNAEPQSASEGAAAPETEGQSASRFHFLVSIHCQETNRRPTAWRKEPDQSSQQIATRSQPSDFQKKTKKRYERSFNIFNCFHCCDSRCEPCAIASREACGFVSQRPPCSHCPSSTELKVDTNTDILWHSFKNPRDESPHTKWQNSSPRKRENATRWQTVC